MRTFPSRNIGITGFMSVRELGVVQAVFWDLVQRYGCCHGQPVVPPRLMAGILVSSKTINGIENRYPGRYPKREILKLLFSQVNSDHTLALCHYNTDHPDDLVTECEQVITAAGSGLMGFQLNLCWPDPVVIKELRRRYPTLHILLQIGATALTEYARGVKGVFAYYDTPGFIDKIKRYEGAVDEVLLDPSGGFGQLLQSDQLLFLVEALMSLEELGIGVAGGLSAETIGAVAPIAAICPYLSIDAQGRLRDPDDRLDLEKVESYLHSAFGLFYPQT